MGKPKRNQSQQQPKKGKKKPQFNKMNSDDDQQVDDVMAWGRKRQNYYRQDEDQYSSLSQEQKEAQQIYKNKYDDYLNDQDVYDVPQQKQDENENKKKIQAQLEQNLDQEETLPQEYVQQQLEWVLQLFKDIQFYENNNLLTIYEKLLKSYLTVIISIKELKIPYIQYHPIIPMAVDIKTKITQLMKKLTVKQQDQSEEPLQKGQKKKSKILQDENISQQQESQQIDFDEEEDVQGENDLSDEQDQLDKIKWNDNDHKKYKKPSNKVYPDHCTQAIKTQSEEHKKGLEYYNSMKAVHEQEKKQKKQQKRQERKANKKPAFKQLKQNEGRFASELILKNKGLIKKRKKIEGNSRVKLRKKYQKKKAIHRARSGHFVKQNPGRAYQGESNIRTGKIAGVRLH